jgi:hypothetical protein
MKRFLCWLFHRQNHVCFAQEHTAGWCHEFWGCLKCNRDWNRRKRLRTL